MVLIEIVCSLTLTLGFQSTLTAQEETILTNYGLEHLENSDKILVLSALQDAFKLGKASKTSDLNASSVPASGGCPLKSNGAIRSVISGDFEGWEGNTIYELDNGQIWQQVDYHYSYHYSFRPKVLIFSDNGRWKMMVEGTDREVSVRCAGS